MQPPQIHFLEMAESEAVEKKIRQRIDRLSRFSKDLQKCEVWVESPHHHHRKGILYAIRIRLTVPGEEIAVHQPAEEDVYVSIRQAFDAARREVQDYERRQRGQVKAHPRAAEDASHRRLVPPRQVRESAG